MTNSCLIEDQSIPLQPTSIHTPPLQGGMAKRAFQINKQEPLQRTIFYAIPVIIHCPVMPVFNGTTNYRNQSKINLFPACSVLNNSNFENNF